MRTSFSSLSTLSLAAIVALGPTLTFAHESPSLHKRTTGAGAGHKRVVNSRRSDAAKREDAASALSLINSALANKTSSTSSVTSPANGGPVKALSNGPPTTPNTTTSAASQSPASTGCFPSAGFKMPSDAPSSTDNWWCEADSEYAFMGFSYEITQCQNKAKLQKEFKDMKQTFNSRYVRLYGACDNKGYYDDIVDAAWDNGLGVHALVWFGFEGGDIWKKRRDTLFDSLKNNPKAKFVTRVVQFGSEPLFDSVLDPGALATQVTAAKKTLAPLGIPVTVSDMAYGFQKDGGASQVLEAMDSVNAHILPFFSTKASTGQNAWPLVQTDIEWFMKHAKGKKLYLDENGWPSTSYSGVKANSAKAVANTDNEEQYFNLLDSKCDYFKSTNGGIGWFFHLYSDEQEPGYGFYNSANKPKFDFKPKTTC